MDKLPSVLPLYKQLDVKKYFGGYLLHPYMSWYTGRGCKSRCTFCLWPQTIGGHKYRFMSTARVVQDVQYVKDNFPEVREIFFDDDTLTDNHDRVEELAKALGPLDVTWSCNAKANVPRKTLEVMKANGLRLLLVGYESGNQQILHNIKKGLLVDVAKRFSKDCHELGIVVHGTFILGLPGETRETIQETLALRQGSEPAHHPGVAGRALSGHLPLQAGQGKWLVRLGRGSADRRRHPDRAAELSASGPHRNLRIRWRTSTRSSISAPPRSWRSSRKCSPVARHAGAPPARRRGVLPVPQEPRRHDRFVTVTHHGPLEMIGRREKLIVTADDFGAAVEVNEAVERAHRDGILSAASLMVAGAAAADAVARAKAMPSLRVGLHLVLVEGRPVLPASPVPDLVDATGHFRTDMARAGAAMFFLPKVRAPAAPPRSRPSSPPLPPPA